MSTKSGSDRTVSRIGSRKKFKLQDSKFKFLVSKLRYSESAIMLIRSADCCIIEQFVFINERAFFSLCLQYILIKRAGARVYQIIRIIFRLLE